MLASTASLSRANSGFYGREYGKIHVHHRTSHFGFQIQLRLESPSSAIYFALTSGNGGTAGQFAIHVDLATGEIWDAANGTGLIGWLNQNMADLQQKGDPLFLRWEIEHHGGALIPRLKIGEEEWLYPAVRFSPDMHYIASAGHTRGETPSTSSAISKGYVWCQDRLAV